MNVWRGTDEHSHLSNLSRRTLTGEDNREYVSVEYAYQTWYTEGEVSTVLNEDKKNPPLDELERALAE